MQLNVVSQESNNAGIVGSNVAQEARQEPLLLMPKVRKQSVLVECGILPSNLLQALDSCPGFEVFSGENNAGQGGVMVPTQGVEALVSFHSGFYALSVVKLALSKSEIGVILR